MRLWYIILYLRTGIHSLHRSEMARKFPCMGWPVLIDQLLVAAGESYGERFGGLVQVQQERVL